VPRQNTSRDRVYHSYLIVAVLVSFRPYAPLKMLSFFSIYINYYQSSHCSQNTKECILSAKAKKQRVQCATIIRASMHNNYL